MSVVDLLIFPDGSPATIKCFKCGTVAAVVATRMERLPSANGSKLVVTDSVMPAKWTRIKVEEVTEDLIEFVKQAITVCPNCTVEIA